MDRLRMEELTTLVTRAQAGDLDAYGEIVRRLQDMACGYAYAILGDFHLAEDAAQEAFLRAYRGLASLREPAALPGWLRRIVSRCCNRLAESGPRRTVPLGAAASVPAGAPAPGQAAEDREMRDSVLQAIRSLPDGERAVTTLFYINGYAHDDIAAFLDVPAGTVKSRLHSARKKLRRRMTTMVRQTLHQNAPDEGFGRAVVEKLLGEPRLLEIETHPVRQIYGAIRRALPGFEEIEGGEIVGREDIANPWTLQFAFPAGGDRVLRTETTATTFKALAGRTPPVRLLTAGRVFRNDPEGPRHRKVFHQCDLICVEAGADEEAMKALLQAIFDAILGPGELRYETTSLPALSPCYKVEAHLDRGWCGVAGCGVFTTEFLSQAGYDPAAVDGYAAGMGLEHLAMLKLGLDDIRTLWRPPYVAE